MLSPTSFPICLAAPERSDALDELCQRWPFTPCADAEGCALYLTAERLELRWHGEPNMGSVYVDFVAGKAAHRRKFGGGEAIWRAIGRKGDYHPRVLDATAGLGRDSFVIASSGSEVQMLERHPVVAALLEDGLRRAQADPVTAAIAARMQLCHRDALSGLGSDITPRPDVVYLDPMFPHRQKSAAVKKEMRIFQQLVGADPDADALLTQARRLALKRVVVKRPAGAPYLDQQTPSGSVTTKGLRFDLYAPLEGND